MREPVRGGGPLVKALGVRLYYGWVVAAVVFLALLVSAGCGRLRQS